MVAIEPGNTEQASRRTGGNSETRERTNGNLLPYQAISRREWRHKVGVDELDICLGFAPENPNGPLA
jgi:hypothetical protein